MMIVYSPHFSILEFQFIVGEGILSFWRRKLDLISGICDVTCDLIGAGAVELGSSNQQGSTWKKKKKD